MANTFGIRTSQYWFLYLDLVDIVLTFTRAERTSDSVKHNNILKLMLPYLAANGHHHYVKAILVYIQQMEDLEVTHSWQVITVSGGQNDIGVDYQQT